MDHNILKTRSRKTNPAEMNKSSLVVVQARDPSVHAAILAHLNQKYGSGSGADPSSPEKNKMVSKHRVTLPAMRCFIVKADVIT